MISLNCLRSHRSGLILGVSLLLAGVVSAQTLFNKPVKVFGDPNFIGTAANPLALIPSAQMSSRVANSPNPSA